MDQSDSRLTRSTEPESDDSASPFNFPPREPDDPLAFEPAPLRYRRDGLTPEKQRAFVEALADCGLVRVAAARVGVSEQAISRVRRRADAVDFDRACEAAQMFGARRLRSIAFERAIEGTLKGHYYHGELVSQERVYDNRLLIYLLGKTEHLLDPPEAAKAVRDNWEPCMDALEQGLPPPEPAGPDRETEPAPTGRQRSKRTTRTRRSGARRASGGPSFRHRRASMAKRKASPPTAITSAPSPKTRKRSWRRAIGKTTGPSSPTAARSGTLISLSPRAATPKLSFPREAETTKLPRLSRVRHPGESRDRKDECTDFAEPKHRRVVASSR